MEMASSWLASTNSNLPAEADDWGSLEELDYEDRINCSSLIKKEGMVWTKSDHCLNSEPNFFATTFSKIKYRF